ncbi:MAG TPA: hypothetical protein VH108_03435 [Gaiellaceae bacterium]|nr:hypothetical protein [Gaiellaceae bacterium]
MSELLTAIAPLAFGGADVAATDYLQTRGWLYADRFTEGPSGTETFSDEVALWGAALSGRGFFETRELTLEDVVLTDWVPRAPGRYHTREAANARTEAAHRILEQSADHVVYSADGKTSMVQGGIGCLRLAAKEIGGQEVKFLSATSSGVVHKGFVVALSLDQYNEVADVIDDRGGVRCTVAGRLRFWKADEKIDLFLSATVPRVYLGVDELRTGSLSPTDLPPIHVTPAVTFEAEDAEYFTFSHFHPADPREVNRAVEWMAGYATDRYHGRVTTDFDELVTRFPDTAAPLKTLMNPEVPYEEIAEIFIRQLSEHNFTVVTNNIRKVVMGDSYEVSGGQVGAFGAGARAEGFVQLQGIDLPVLAEELGRLRLALRERGTAADQDIAIGEVAQAEEAAREGDEERAFKHLKRAGRWALSVATEIGTSVATTALSRALG